MIGSCPEGMQSHRLVWAVAGAVFAVKAWISWHTYGTNDITAWMDFARYVSTQGTYSIYEDIPTYNHPPLMSLWLKFLMWLTGGSTEYFPRLFRLAPIAADFASAILLWKITRAYFDERQALLRTLIAVSSPILIMVSGFHGNTDPIFGFLILLAGYFLAVRRQWVTAALVLALAVNVKIVPLLAVPAFFFWIRNTGQKVGFALCFGGAALLGYLAHLAAAPGAVVENIFLYSGIGRIWGLGRLLYGVENYRGLGIVLAALSILYFANRVARLCTPGTKVEDVPAECGLHLFRALALAYVSFLCLTSGFGVQYLSWLATLVVFLDVFWAVLYTLSGSLFLFLVYSHWAGGFPWDYANSWEAGPWPPAAVVLSYMTWLCTAGMFVQNLWALERTGHPGRWTPGASS